MKFLVIATLTLLHAVTSKGVERRAVVSTCARDNCLRSVIASNIATGPARGSSDCASFFSTTISSLCTNYFTTTTATITSTGTDTLTRTATAFTTSTLTQPPVVVKRAAAGVLPPSIGLAEAVPLERRQAPAVPTTCSITTIIPTAVPSYASFCSGTIRYSSACSCDGLSSTVVTSSSTTTVTVSVAATSSVPLATATTTSTSTVLVSTACSYAITLSPMPPQASLPTATATAIFDQADTSCQSGPAGSKLVTSFNGVDLYDGNSASAQPFTLAARGGNSKGGPDNCFNPNAALPVDTAGLTWQETQSGIQYNLWDNNRGQLALYDVNDQAPGYSYSSRFLGCS